MPVGPVIPWLREGMGALAGIAVTGMLMLAYYEGLPVGPLRHVPILQDFVQGRVAAERRKAREGYVAEAWLAAIEAKLAERDRQLAAGRKALAGYAELLRDAQAREAELSEQDARDEAEFEEKLKAAGRSCHLDRSDIDWLRR